MKAMSSVGFAAALLFSVGSFTAAPSSAQQKMSAPAAPRPAVVHSRPAATHVVAARPASAPRHPAAAAQYSGIHFNSAANAFQFADGSPASLQDLINPVPGLGFDYHHLSVINQDLAIKALIDPATEWKLAEARKFLHGSRFAGSGFYLLDGGAYYPVADDSSQQPEPAGPVAAPADINDQTEKQPQVILVQAPASQQQSSDASSAAVQEEEQIPDVGQFTLVLQNGQRLQAIAFTRANDKIVYITSDGFRGTISIADVNADATRQINADRGSPIELPL
jgi:hypothetical protein